MESLTALSNQIASLVSTNDFQTLSLTEIMNRARVETVIASMAKLINSTYPDALRSNILR
jgi:hypothetical protein